MSSIPEVVTSGAVTLWHASDDPSIEIFRPHRAPTAQVDDDLVWAVDDAHVPAYWFPRDCPRATFWTGPRTTPDDIAWLSGATRVHAIEWAWWERFRAGRVYLYLMPTTTFELHAAEAGYYVSREAVTPLARIEIDDLVRKHAESGVELRVMDELWSLWDKVTTSTLEFSGIRLRNARARATPLPGPT
jgi:hypothetical protein